MSLPLTNAKKQYQDQSGNPLAGGSVAYYIPGTLTPVNTYLDQALTTANTNPVLLDANGQAVAWIADATSVREIVKDSFGNQIWDQVTAVGNGQNLSGSSGSSFVGFQQAGLGAIQRTSQDKMRDIVCVFDFMTPAQIADAKANTQTYDLTSAMQAAHNTGSFVYYPKGAYKFSTLTIAQGGILGDGEAYTYLSSTDIGTGNTITYSATNVQPGANAAVFRHFILTGLSGKPSGSGIMVTATTGENQGAQFDSMSITGFPNSLSFGAASLWNIQNCKFLNFRGTGVVVANTNNPDSGDSSIMGSQFITSTPTGTSGVTYQSSGGLRIIGNKFNGCAYGIILNLNAPSSTSDLFIIGNSLENGTAVAIQLSRASGTASFYNVIIIGNETENYAYGISSDSSGSLSNLVINGNVLTLSSAGVYGITLSSGANFNISGNVIQGNGGSPVGISIAAACANGKIGQNTYSNLAGTIVNSSTTTFIEPDLQNGTQAVTTSTAYGSLFSGSQAITFPTPFSVVPVVNCSLGSGAGGGVAASPLAVTKTGFNLFCIGVTSGGSVTCAWNAQGVI